MPFRGAQIPAYNTGRRQGSNVISHYQTEWQMSSHPQYATTTQTVTDKPAGQVMNRGATMTQQVCSPNDHVQQIPQILFESGSRQETSHLPYQVLQPDQPNDMIFSNTVDVSSNLASLQQERRI